MTVDLQACRFCGGEAVLRQKMLDERYGYATEVSIRCKRCGIGLTRVDDSNPKGGYALEGTGLAAAVKVWNHHMPADEEFALAVGDFMSHAALFMLHAPMFDDGDPATFDDFVEMPETEDARRLGTVFANGRCYNGISDIRADEIEDAKSILIERALRYAIAEIGRRDGDG